MTVRLFFDRIFFCVSIALLASCSQSQKEASQEKITDAVEGTNDLRVDTNNADITLENFLQVKPGQAGDSLYRNFISGLIKVHKFNASVEHLKAYYGAFNKTADQKSFALMRLGEVYNALAQYELAIKYFRDALEVNLKAGDSARAAECEHSIGYNLQLTGDLAQSIEHIYKALKFYEQKNDSDNICIAFFDIAESYYRQENFTKAFEFYKHCHDYYRGKADTFQLAQALTYLCDVQHKLNLNDDALRDGNAAIALWKHLADAEGEANCLNTMAGIYFDQKKYEDAIKFYKEAYDLVMTTEFQRPLPVLMMNLGVCYTNTGSYPIAEKYLLSSIEELKKAGMVSELQLAYRHASVLYKKLDMPEKALRNYEQFDSIQNILAEKQSSESIERLNLKYETAKAQNEIMELSREKKHTETKERIFILVTAIVLLLLAMVITIILLRNRQRRKNLETEKAMKELELSKAKLKH
jgi:tetratricopeptide (TPR) repeat protein